MIQLQGQFLNFLVRELWKRNGLYPSFINIFLRTQPRYLSGNEFEGNANEAKGTESSSTTEESCVESVPAPAKATECEVCKVCNCTFQKSQSCLRCEQNHEYEESLWADAEENASQEPQSENSVSLLFMEEMREFRLAHFQNSIFCPPVQSNVAASQEIAATSSALHREENSLPGPNTDMTNKPGENGLMSFTMHHSVICSYMIAQFKVHETMNYELVFTVLNERGNKEEGVVEGVEREVYSLFWKQFSSSMTIGERERVPFVRHDHFIKEWEAVGRILVKGYKSASFFPMFLSKAFMCYCLFDAEVPDSFLLESFIKYLSPVSDRISAGRLFPR